MEYELFQAFEKEEYIHTEYLQLLTNYICVNLNSHYSPNSSYYYQQYNYVTKLKIVCMWKQKHGLPTVSCKGEAICNDQLVNFFKDKEHKNCICSAVWIMVAADDNVQKITFELFLDYWNTIVHRQNFGSVETFAWTSMIFSSLRFYWIVKIEGELEKLEHITWAMDYLDEDLDPNPYIYNGSSYIKKLLDWEIEK